MSDTIHARPLPLRPENGWLAWVATIGYISAHHNPDAMLTVRAYPAGEDAIGWAAQASWGPQVEEVGDAPSLDTALRQLWREVDRHHVIFSSAEDSLKAPTHYNVWLDAETQAVLDRLLELAQAAFGGDWRLFVVYQPVESPKTRVQMRLMAKGDSVNIGGRGPSLCDAARALYRNAVHGGAGKLKGEML